MSVTDIPASSNLRMLKDEHPPTANKKQIIKLHMPSIRHKIWLLLKILTVISNKI